MHDVVDFASPLGRLGRAADRLVVGPHLSRFLRRRAEAIRRAAEEPPP
jgi:hypothetical protein